jgi:hypothetical protein
MNEIFNYCVKLLYWVASLTGTTYEEINVVLFVFLIPTIILVLVVKLILLKRRVTFFENTKHFKNQSIK